ncbi:MAG: hypothetical protein M0C28_15985, partial [Candidatus Moduliflexus flocculans]|nr:hypothetical protein [Candidatus Moduliflexus flocculans]
LAVQLRIAKVNPGNWDTRLQHLIDGPGRTTGIHRVDSQNARHPLQPGDGGKNIGADFQHQGSSQWIFHESPSRLHANAVVSQEAVAQSRNQADGRISLFCTGKTMTGHLRKWLVDPVHNHSQ